MAALAPLAEDRDCVRQRLVGLRVRLGGPDKEPELQDLLHLDALACQHFQQWYGFDLSDGGQLWQHFVPHRLDHEL